MDLINMVNNMSDDRVRLLLLLQQQHNSNKVISPEPGELPLPTTLLKPRLPTTPTTPTTPITPTPQPTPTTPTTPPTIKKIVKSTPKTPNTNFPYIPTEPESTSELNTNNEPAQPKDKLSRGKHRVGVTKPQEELSTNPIAILRRQQYEAKKSDDKFLQEKARKAREYRARKKLEAQQQQTN